MEAFREEREKEHYACTRKSDASTIMSLENALTLPYACMLCFPFRPDASIRQHIRRFYGKWEFRLDAQSGTVDSEQLRNDRLSRESLHWSCISLPAKQSIASALYTPDASIIANGIRLVSLHCQVVIEPSESRDRAGNEDCSA